MAGEAGIILKLVEPIKSVVFGAVLDYLGYIGSCEDNLRSLRSNLSEVCDKKDDINKKVKEGKDKQEKITREAGSWLISVRLLSEAEELKDLMYKDLETAKFVVKMMGKKNLKKLISKEREMHEVVVKVMKMLKDEMEKSVEDARMVAQEDYKEVAEVVVEVMKDATEEFKKLMKEDKKMAIIAARLLMDSDLDKLTKGDMEMEEIFREIGNVSDDELWLNYENEDQQETNALQVKAPTADVESNLVKEAKKLFAPLGYLLTPLGKMMDDPNFKGVVPEANSVKFGLEVIDGLLMNTGKNDRTEQQRGCCSCTLSLSHYHGRYHISKAAELMANRIKDAIISKCPQDPVTLPISTVDLKLIPTRFLKGLDSRVKLLHEILEKLKDDHVDVVGVFGMGGTGKTTLAKEVSKKAQDIFNIKVMVEISDAPDIVRIQAAIAESIDLPLHDVDDITLRATKLYNRLNAEKDKKILVILDNIWKKLDLDEIGIPSNCKLLLTTREKEVCRVMNVQDVNIMEVGVMNANEARELFNNQIGKEADKREYKKIADRLLSKCGGLPLAIVAIANSLKDKNLSNWEKFADDLEKPISSTVIGDFRHTYSILDTSYKFIEGDEKRMFFLLVCLSPLGSSVSVESLMRYGIGLNLFQHVNKLDEAMDLANKWANELVLSSMLLEGDAKGDVKIHDIVRAFGISFAAKEEGHKFLVEAIPRWLDEETFKKYTAISLMSGNDLSRLSGVEADKLQILILKDDLSHKFPDSFFTEMVNLVVLSLSNVNFNPSLPESMRKLKKLKTLRLEECKLGDIKLIGELVNLLVLSLRESFMEELPNEIGELNKLRLLDLNGCTSTKVPLIPAGILGRLTKLEGLYAFRHNKAVVETKRDEVGASAAENHSLPYLSALEIKVSQIEELPIDYESIRNLDEFRLHVGDWPRDSQKGQFRSVLKLKGIDDMDGVLAKSRCLKPLLKKADLLEIESCINFEHLVPQLDHEGFRNLKDLALERCDDVKCIVQGSGINDSIAACPHLESLKLIWLDNLEMVCDEKAPPRSFSNLQNIILYDMKKLLYVLPLALLPPNLNEIYVRKCKSMKFLFTGDEETQVTKLAFLKSLKLCELEDLLSLVGPTNFSNTSDAMQDHQIFFAVKIELPSLERLELNECRGIVKLWGSEAHASAFQNLKDIKIWGCGRLLSIGPFCVLVHLDTLKIYDCESIEEIVTFEGESKIAEQSEIVTFEGESKIAEQSMKFLELRCLELDGLKKLKRFYGGSSKLEFPKLNKLSLCNLGTFNVNAESENSSVSFHEKIDYPYLEELVIKDAFGEFVGLWNWQSLIAERGTTATAAILKKLTLIGAAASQGIPSIIFENLSSLDLLSFEVDHALFSSREGFAWTYNQLPRLQELTVAHSRSLKELFEKEDCNGDDIALRHVSMFCGRLKELELIALPKLNHIPLHLFKSLTALSLVDIKWEYLISADAIGESLQQLEVLKILGCRMKALVVNVAFVIELPRLKKMVLASLNYSFSISSALRLRSLESLEIQRCKQLEYLWSGSIEAPNLQHVKLTYCDNMEHLLDGNPEQNGDLHLPSLVSVEIKYCPRMRSFSLTRPVAPKLTHVLYEDKEYSMLQFDDLNHFLRTKTEVKAQWYLQVKEHDVE